MKARISVTAEDGFKQLIESSCEDEDSFPSELEFASESSSGLLVMYSTKGVDGNPMVEVFLTTPEFAQVIAMSIPSLRVGTWIEVPAPKEGRLAGLFKLTEDLRVVRVIDVD